MEKAQKCSLELATRVCFFASLRINNGDKKLWNSIVANYEGLFDSAGDVGAANK